MREDADVDIGFVHHAERLIDGGLQFWIVTGWQVFHHDGNYSHPLARIHDVLTVLWQIE